MKIRKQEVKESHRNSHKDKANTFEPRKQNTLQVGNEKITAFMAIENPKPENKCLPNESDQLSTQSDLESAQISDQC